MGLNINHMNGADNMRKILLFILVILLLNLSAFADSVEFHEIIHLNLKISIDGSINFNEMKIIHSVPEMAKKAIGSMLGIKLN